MATIMVLGALAPNEAFPSPITLRARLAREGHKTAAIAFAIEPDSAADHAMAGEQTGDLLDRVREADTIVLMYPWTADALATAMWAIGGGKRSIVMMPERWPASELFGAFDRIAHDEDALVRELSRGWRADVEGLRIADWWTGDDPGLDDGETYHRTPSEAMASAAHYEPRKMWGTVEEGPWVAVRVPPLEPAGADDVRLFSSEDEALRFASDRRAAVRARDTGREVKAA